MRITGGHLRGRSISSVGTDATRPTTDMMRERLFSVLTSHHVLPDASVLDLFAGSGALGFEALSRGAAHVTFVDSSPIACTTIRQTSRSLAVEDRVTIIRANLPGSLLELPLNRPSTIVFADPPYDLLLANSLVSLLQKSESVSDTAVFCLEHRDREYLIPADGIRSIKSLSHGDIVIDILQRVPIVP